MRILLVDDEEAMIVDLFSPAASASTEALKRKEHAGR